MRPAAQESVDSRLRVVNNTTHVPQWQDFSFWDVVLERPGAASSLFGSRVGVEVKL